MEFPQGGDHVEYSLNFVSLRPGIFPEMRDDVTARTITAHQAR